MKKWTFAIYTCLFIWIVLWTTLSGCLVYFTNNKIYYILLVMDVFCFFNLFWWTIIRNQKRSLDRFTIGSLLITLNFPAYFLAKKARKIIILQEIDNNQSARTLDLEEDLQDPFISDWEKSRIEEKLAKKSKNKKIIDDKTNIIEDNFSILLQTYNQFLLAEILKKEPKLYDSYEINEKMRIAIGEKTVDLINLEKFVKVASDWMVAEKHDSTQLRNFFTNLEPEQIYQNHKINRVDNIIFVRQRLNLPFE